MSVDFLDATMNGEYEVGVPGKRIMSVMKPWLSGFHDSNLINCTPVFELRNSSVPKFYLTVGVQITLFPFIVSKNALSEGISKN